MMAARASRWPSTEAGEVKDPRCKVEGVRKGQQVPPVHERIAAYNRPLEETGGSGFKKVLVKQS